MLEPSKLSDNDIIDLCYEFYNEFVLISKDCKKYPKKPTVKLVELGEYIKTPSWRFRGSNYAVISNIFQGAILDQSLPSHGCRSVFSWKLTYPYNIKNILDINICTFGGIIGNNWGYDNIYYGLLGELNIDNPINKLFWDWYNKSLDVLAMYYLKKDNTCYVIKKPDELKINIDKNEAYFRYGDEEFYYRNKVRIPAWLYKTKPEDLKIEDFLLLQNADAKAVFVEKFGSDRLVK